jgi:hypothetical protein
MCLCLYVYGFACACVPACVFGVKLAAVGAVDIWARLVDLVLVFVSKFDGEPPFVFTASAEACVLCPAKMVSSCVVYIDCSLMLTEMYRVGLRGHSSCSLASGWRCWFLRCLAPVLSFPTYVAQRCYQIHDG